LQGKKKSGKMSKPFKRNISKKELRIAEFLDPLEAE